MDSRLALPAMGARASSSRFNEAPRSRPISKGEELAARRGDLPQRAGRLIGTSYPSLILTRTPGRVPASETIEEMSRESKFPPGWDEERVRRLLSHYEEQTDDEAVAEDEAAFEDSTQAVVEVPKELLPEVRKLIARHRAS
jgi:hypothetical protein